MSFFNDNTALCLTGKGDCLDLDWYRPEYPCNENWIDWDDEVPVIGMIDAPEYVPAGGCRFDDGFLGDCAEQSVIKR